MTLLDLFGFAGAQRARPAITELATAAARSVAAGPCRFYERQGDVARMAWTLWVPGCHLLVFNPTWLETAPAEQVRFVVFHELGHVVLGHARRAWHSRPDRAVAEDEADEFAERMTGTGRAIRQGPFAGGVSLGG